MEERNVGPELNRRIDVPLLVICTLISHVQDANYIAKGSNDRTIKETRKRVDDEAGIYAVSIPAANATRYY